MKMSLRTNPCWRSRKSSARLEIGLDGVISTPLKHSQPTIARRHVRYAPEGVGQVSTRRVNLVRDRNQPADQSRSDSAIDSNARAPTQQRGDFLVSG